jgi:hypothetical protein
MCFLVYSIICNLWCSYVCKFHMYGGVSVNKDHLYAGYHEGLILI